LICRKDLDQTPNAMQKIDLPLQEFRFESITVDDTGREVERRPGCGQQFIEDLGGGVTIEMVAIPAGSFQMGSLRENPGGEESPQHLVSVPAFFLSKSLVTQEQWLAVNRRLPPCRFYGAKLPIENTTWIEAADFAGRLSKKTRQAYRLPGEAEWEFACRAGTGTPFSTGVTITAALANYCGPHTYRHEAPGLYRHVSTPAGTFPPNPFGLFDMHANLWEMCADLWHPDYTGAPFEASPWIYGGEPGFHPARGGSWHEPPANCRSASRLRIKENERDDLIGFRLAM
jgi:formylglycine-generating enzyme required for sulfatase activity